MLNADDSQTFLEINFTNIFKVLEETLPESQILSILFVLSQTSRVMRDLINNTLPSLNEKFLKQLIERHGFKLVSSFLQDSPQTPWETWHLPALAGYFDLFSQCIENIPMQYRNLAPIMLSGQVEFVRQCVEAQLVPLDDIDKDANSAWYFAGWSGSIEVIEYLATQLTPDVHLVYGVARSGNIQAVEYVKLNYPDLYTLSIEHFLNYEYANSGSLVSFDKYVERELSQLNVASVILSFAEFGNDDDVYTFMKRALSTNDFPDGFISDLHKSIVHIFRHGSLALIERLFPELEQRFFNNIEAPALKLEVINATWESGSIEKINYCKDKWPDEFEQSLNTEWGDQPWTLPYGKITPTAIISSGKISVIEHYQSLGGQMLSGPHAEMSLTFSARMGKTHLMRYFKSIPDAASGPSSSKSKWYYVNQTLISESLPAFKIAVGWLRNETTKDYVMLAGFYRVIFELFKSVLITKSRQCLDFFIQKFKYHPAISGSIPYLGGVCSYPAGDIYLLRQYKVIRHRPILLTEKEVTAFRNNPVGLPQDIIDMYQQSNQFFEEQQQLSRILYTGIENPFYLHCEAIAVMFAEADKLMGSEEPGLDELVKFLKTQWSRFKPQQEGREKLSRPQIEKLRYLLELLKEQLTSIDDTLFKPLLLAVEQALIFDQRNVIAYFAKHFLQYATLSATIFAKHFLQYATLSATIQYNSLAETLLVRSIASFFSPAKSNSENAIFPHRALAKEIADYLNLHQDMSFSDCLAYIEEKTETLTSTLPPDSPFALLVNFIKREIKRELLDEQSRLEMFHAKTPEPPFTPLFEAPRTRLYIR